MKKPRYLDAAFCCLYEGGNKTVVLAPPVRSQWPAPLRHPRLAGPTQTARSRVSFSPQTRFVFPSHISIFSTHPVIHVRILDDFCFGFLLQHACFTSSKSSLVYLPLMPTCFLAHVPLLF